MSTAATTSQTTTSSSSSSSQTSIKNNNKSNDLTKSNSKDDETCDDWEQLDQIQIKKSLQSIKLSSEKKDEENIANTQTTSSNPSTNTIPFISNMQNNSNSSFPQPSIKILKRPPSDKKLNELASQPQTNTNQPIKTFKQREQEYAEARLRILGSAHPEDEETSTSTTTNVNTNTNSNKQQQQQQQNKPTNYYNNQMQNNNSNENSYQRSLNSNNINNNTKQFVIRDPINPDGTRGFRGYDNENGTRNLNAKQ